MRKNESWGEFSSRLFGPLSSLAVANQVWGCMCRDGVGSLHVVEGRMNARTCINLISSTLKEDGKTIIGEDSSFSKMAQNAIQQSTH